MQIKRKEKIHWENQLILLSHNQITPIEEALQCNRKEVHIWAPQVWQLLHLQPLIQSQALQSNLLHDKIKVTYQIDPLEVQEVLLIIILELQLLHLHHSRHHLIKIREASLLILGAIHIEVGVEVQRRADIQPRQLRVW